MSDSIRTWSIEAVVPAVADGRSWNKNINLQVIATTMENAMRAARQQYPEIKFIKVMADRWIQDVIIAEEIEVNNGPVSTDSEPL